MITSPFFTRLAPAAGLVATLFLNSCMVGPDYQTPSSPAPGPTYKETDDKTWKKAQPKDDEIRGKWWEMYHDPELNALEEQVNISNQNVLQAEANFREAAAAVKVADAALFPTITASPSLTQSHTSESLTRGRAGAASSSGGSVSSSVDSGHAGGSSSLYNLPVQATYMVDIWGAVRRNVEATSATAQASFATLENARLSYQATLAQDYFSLRGLDAQEALLQQTVASYQKYLDLTTNRYKSGIASNGDVALAKTQLETTQAQLIDLGVARAQYEHAIAVLVGQPATLFSLRSKQFAGTPPHIPVGVPSTLLERRPDIAAAERTVASANASIGVAVSAYYPSLTLTGTTGLEAIRLADLFSGPSFFWSVGPALAQTLFNGGATHGQVQEAQANYEAQVAAYRQTVLTAFQQVEDNLSALKILGDEAVVASEAVKSAKQSLDIATNQYKAGTDDYLTVITAQATALNDEINEVSIRTRRMTSSVLLIQALGGGWSTKQLATPHEVHDVPEADAKIQQTKVPAN